MINLVYRRREHSLSDLRETLIDGAVPDLPVHHVNRRDLFESLSNSLRTLANHFRVGRNDDPTEKLAELTLGRPNSETGSLLPFAMAADLQSDWQPPPTNAWLLVYGMAGCGKTVLCTSTLRRNPGLLTEYFPGGVFWLQVGSLTSPSQTPTFTTGTSAVPHSLTSQLISLIDRLERKVLPPTRYSVGECHWSDSPHNTPPMSQSPPSGFSPGHLVPSLHESSERLRRALMRRQQRTTWGPDNGDRSITSLVLVVLDDVWDVEVGRVLSSMPAAFLVTSRDQKVLQHVETPVNLFHVGELLDSEVVQLLSNWTERPIRPSAPPPVCTAAGFSTASLSDQFPSLSSLATLTRGIPFAVTLLGHLLGEHYHRILDYFCDPTGSGQQLPNWRVISRPSAYGYDTVFATVHKSIAHLSVQTQCFYSQLVIFDADVLLIPKVAAILWGTNEDVAECVLSELTRFSLAKRLWVQTTRCYGYYIHALLLDVLKVSIGATKQAAYHAQFVSNYEHHCSGRWSRLVSTAEYHAYFWHEATEHVYKSGRLDRLVDLMINLEFLRGRLAVLGSSLVIAEFNRYRAVFATLGRMSEWNAYLRFIQTNAYFVIDPVVVLPTERGRSPYRTNTRSDSSWSLDSSSPAHRTDYALTHTSKPVAASRTIASNLGPKGLDLIQLGLGLPQNSPVFQQALHWLLKQHQLAGSPSKENLTPKKNQPTHPAKHSHISEYYWFWCNSHVAASQLIWAIPTGPQAVTCLSVELPLDKGLSNGTHHPPMINGEHEQSHLSRMHPLGFRKRFLAATRGGRVLLLDAVSGYEVAVQQTYPPDVEVKFLSFLSNNTECLTCGSDGSLVVSTLPPAEPIDPLHSQASGDQHDHDAIAVEDSHHFGTSPNGHHGDLMGGLDVDELLEDNEFNTLAPKRPISIRFDVPDVNESWSVDAPGIGWNTGRRSSAPTTIFALSGIKVKSPTVLAKIPRLTEVVRVDGNRTVANASQPVVDGSVTTYTLHSIAAPANLCIVVLSGQGSLDADIRPTNEPPVNNVQSELVVSLPSVYFLKRAENHLFLDCSRQLRLPALDPDSPMYRLLCQQHGCVRTLVVAVSSDAQLVASALQDGHIWIYSLEQIGWLTCISTRVAVSFAAMMTDLSTTGKKPFDTSGNETDPDSTALHTGPIPSCCIFLPQRDADDHNKTGNSRQSLFVAAVGPHVFLWSLPDTVPQVEGQLATPQSVRSLSKPSLSLNSASVADVLCLDACLLAGQYVLAGGTTNGRVLFWRVCDGCRLFELSAHSTWITSVRLLPPTQTVPNESNPPIGVLTASGDGVIKRWDVGASCLPSPTTPLSDGPAWPLTPPWTKIPSHQDNNQPELPPRDTAVHGLWTDVFSVWFGFNGMLIVLGRRRHSADLQFLFRAQQFTRIGEHVDDRTFAFQEITFKPSQPLYWRPPRRPAIVVRPWGLHPEPPSDLAATSALPEPSVHPDKDTVPDRIAVRSSSVPPTDKHWILTSGLAGSIHGRATAVSFWSSGLWVAVGFSTGLVLTFSLHFDEVHLYGIVKRYCLVDSRLTSESTRSKLQSVDRVVHLHTWQSEPRPDGSVTLVVLAVFATGSVTFWHIGSATHDLSTFDSGCEEVSPAGFWLPMHNVDSADPSGRLRKLSDLEVQSRVLCDTDLTELTVPIVWSSLRRIPHLSTFADAHSSEIPQAPDRVRHILVWLTAGVDGLVFGRQVVLPSTDLVTDEVTKRPNRTFPPWRLDLEAHRPWVITDADVDPTGKWLVTASTDKTAKVWSLESGVSVFETAKHPACVRTVCFRPVLDASIGSSAEEWFIATGDDAGALRIWSLTSHTLQDSVDHTWKRSRCSRAVSPNSYGVLRQTPSLNVDRPSPSEHIGNSFFVTSVRHPTRLPSPDLKPDNISSGFACTRASHIPPRFHSNAAGAGGTWLRRLVWSPDGRLLTGLSDRLCVWPFEPAATHPTNVHDNYTSDPIPHSHVQTTSYPPFQQPRHLLHRCRVLRVLSSGVSDVTNSSLNLLMVSPRRQLAVCSQNNDNNSHDLPAYLSEMPPTLVTVDANTGTLYIFDPIGALFCSELAR
ncbi:Apoptotic protease-activating factor 1 [Paragonimus heterotremus]|uniref:Apoptotic protease-activating factor 1 n=1 Tax=Paragonimus heterotremus TaxID=100268 RepID=A0A8J4WS64_9TREM|nr:Apoptotic protease-activating factor 1 [Paragonimus heterotremus]